jgi:hypothetical protein
MQTIKLLAILCLQLGIANASELVICNLIKPNHNNTRVGWLLVNDQLYGTLLVNDHTLDLDTVSYISFNDSNKNISAKIQREKVGSTYTSNYKLLEGRHNGVNFINTECTYRPLAPDDINSEKKRTELKEELAACTLKPSQCVLL